MKSTLLIYNPFHSSVYGIKYQEFLLSNDMTVPQNTLLLEDVEIRFPHSPYQCQVCRESVNLIHTKLYVDILLSVSYQCQVSRESVNVIHTKLYVVILLSV